MSRTIDRVWLMLGIWRRVVQVRRGLAATSLSDLCRRFGTREGPSPRRRDPVNLGRAISRATDLGVYRPRCLTLALVHYRMLTEQGLDPVLVVGLREDSPSKDAHAWVELSGVDVGPPPGRGGRRPLARFDRNGPLMEV